MKKRTSLLIIVSVFAVAWLFGFMRFESNTALVLFKTLMFPFGYIYIIIETYAGTLSPDHTMQNEYLQGVLFVTCIMLQAILYVVLFYLIKRKKQ